MEDKSEGELNMTPGGLPTDSTLASIQEGTGGADVHAPISGRGSHKENKQCWGGAA